MKTAIAPVIFGWGPDGPRSGEVRFEVPEGMNPSTLRFRIRRGTCALHGPSNRGDIDAPYRLLDACGNGWSVGEKVYAL